MLLIGEIVRLQVQRSTLKVPAQAGAAHPLRYVTAPLIEVQALELTPGGTVGVFDTGERVIDVHHVDHPSSKNHERANDVSIGFTAHYAAMRQRFGDHLDDGIAGENVLVRSERQLTPDQLAGDMVVETNDGIRATLERVIVAEPCVPFTRFSLRLGPMDPSGANVTDSLRFLREGTRGFYASFAGATVTLRPGDRVFGFSH